MSVAGKLLAGGTALIWLLWLFWLPIAQNNTAQSSQTFLPTISDTEVEAVGDEKEVYLPAITGESQSDK